jgi:O-antigen/teichoic acid export membrane protein
MTTSAMSIRRARAYVQVARTDSLVRNSLFMMSSTVATALLGYVFWIVAARVFSGAEVGTASAVISLCSTVALLTYLGPAAMLVERLHAYERSREWTSFLVQMSVATAAATAVVAAVAIPVVARSKGYGPFFDTAGAAVLAVIGAASWTLLNMYCSAFIAARRAGGLLAVQGLVSLFKVLLVVPLCAAGLGAPGLVVAWVASSVAGVAVGALWLLPRLRLGASPERTGRRRAPRAHRAHRARPARHARAPRRPGWRADYFWHLIGQHLTSVGGQLTPLILPILVVLRLGTGPNAYFYITWMIGSVFFMVSPSISSALFAENVRARSGLRPTVVKAFRVIAFLLLPTMVIMVAGGKLILSIVGHEYAGAGYGLLVLLAISAVPDAVSNVAVAIYRATNRLGYSAAINIGILIVTSASAWCLMPGFGLLGVGYAWLGAQLLGALVSIPAFRNLGEGTPA